MKKILSGIAAAVAVATLSLPVLADPVTLKFENLPNGSPLPDQTQIRNTYAGFHFSDTLWSIRSVHSVGSVGTGAFSGGAPGSQFGAVTLFDSSAADGDILQVRVDVAGGFGTKFSMSVATVVNTKVSMRAYDASGHLLQQALSSGADGQADCANNEVCNWESLSMALANGARASYVELSAPIATAWFDDMSFGDVGQNTVPEPDGALLGMAALGALALSRRLGRR